MSALQVQHHREFKEYMGLEEQSHQEFLNFEINVNTKLNYLCAGLQEVNPSLVPFPQRAREFEAAHMEVMREREQQLRKFREQQELYTLRDKYHVASKHGTKASSSSSKKRNRKEIIAPDFDDQRFQSKFHEDQYNWMKTKKIIPEVGFDLEENQHRDITEEIRRRKWDLFCSPPQPVELALVHKFYANAHWDGDGELPYLSYVRGQIIDFGPENTRKVLRLPKPSSSSAGITYETRMKTISKYEDVLLDICE
ncbi:hypothetical protein PIB30_037707 [Stylosanthes scabra]|uniref:Uncharacterized protein n=1 Tax=Stylosanthes scabra TaxID=79078 RepID=A0ABU6YE25_9FABA|nr:hypothetical protein [Stylosanthes scabra]